MKLENLNDQELKDLTARATELLASREASKEPDWEHILGGKVILECEICGKMETIPLKEFCDETGWRPDDSRLDCGALWGECKDCRTDL